MSSLSENSIKFFDPIRVYYEDTKVRFTFLQQILREEVDHSKAVIGETLIASANSSVVCINTQTYKPRGLPSQVLQALEAIEHAD